MDGQITGLSSDFNYLQELLPSKYFTNSAHADTPVYLETYHSRI